MHPGFKVEIWMNSSGYKLLNNSNGPIYWFPNDMKIIVDQKWREKRCYLYIHWDLGMWMRLLQYFQTIYRFDHPNEKSHCVTEKKIWLRFSVRQVPSDTEKLHIHYCNTFFVHLSRSLCTILALTLASTYVPSHSGVWTKLNASYPRSLTKKGRKSPVTGKPL